MSGHSTNPRVGVPDGWASSACVPEGNVIRIPAVYPFRFSGSITTTDGATEPENDGQPNQLYLSRIDDSAMWLSASLMPTAH